MSDAAYTMSRRIRGVSVFSGAGGRPVQEDQILASRERGIFILADGFGGPVAGVRAAKIACDEVRNFLFKEAGDRDATLPFELRSYFSLAGNVLFNALIHANRKVWGQNTAVGVNERGGASVVAGFVDDDLLAIANVGACSAWLYRGGEMRELVIPRTLARMRDPMGGAAASPELQIPLMALGMGEDLEPEIFEYRIQPGDWLLFQTDGVGPSAREEVGRLAQTYIRKGPPAETALNELNRILREDSNSDNYSVSLVIF